jgi:hypothetical protein
MTMFSMKPKFDLAEFLAQPAKPNSSRRRNMMYSASRANPVSEAETASEDAPAQTKNESA